MKYIDYVAPKAVPQSEAVFGKDMVENPAGGFVFKITPEQHLVRFLTLGCEDATIDLTRSISATYYETGKALTAEVVKSILEMVKLGEDPVRVIVDVSTAKPSRVAKMDASIFALALCATIRDSAGFPMRQKALSALPQVCRIPTHLFSFIDAYKALGGGWGSATKKAVANWYLRKNDSTLAYHVMKYQGRNGWTNRDLFRLSHIKPTTDVQNSIIRWAVTGEVPTGDLTGAQEYLVRGNELLRGDPSKKRAIELISDYDFTHELVPTSLQKDPDVWMAMLKNMPLTAMIRNLGRMTALGILNTFSDGERMVCRTLNQERVVAARVHPMNILVAHRQYRAGKGLRGSLTWNPNSRVLAALEDAFYMAFGNVEATNKRFLLGLDVSASMSWGSVMGIPGFTPYEAAGALALLPVKTEPYTFTGGFATSFTDLKISKNDSIESVVAKMRKLHMGGTDCTQPMLHAMKNKIPVDVFMVYTDNETWFGDIHPSQALKQYRDKTGINAKLIVNALTGTHRSIADPSDPGMLDISGFDTTQPQIVRNFVLG